LENYLSALELESKNNGTINDRQHQINLAKFQADNERWLKDYEIQNNHSIEMFRSVITTGQSALKGSMVINGGGAMALLAFIGNVFHDIKIEKLDSSLAWPVLIFCVGILFSALASGTTYLTQFLYQLEWLKTGKAFHLSTVLLVLCSYAAFGFACYTVFRIFSGL